MWDRWFFVDILEPCSCPVVDSWVTVACELELPRGWIMGHSAMWVSFCYRLPCFTHQNMPRLMIANEYAATWFSLCCTTPLPLRTGLIGGEVSRLGAQVPTCSAPWILQRQVSARHQLHRARDQRVVPVISSAHQVVKFELAVSCGVKKYVKPIVVSWWFQWFYAFSKYPSGTGYSTFYPF